MTSQPRPFDLVAALKPDVGIIKTMADEKGIVLDVQMPPSALVTGDDNMLATVVRNLLTNAVKFTATGGNIALLITENSGKYIVTVSDTGTGMTQE